MTQIREEAYFTRGRVIVRGKTVHRGEARKADYLLYFKPNLPLAVVEAKDNKHSVGNGMQHALAYAEMLDLPFAYSSNGDAFLEHDRTATTGAVTRDIPLEQFPTPAELWQRYRTAKGCSHEQETTTTKPYYDDGTGKQPRYYQQIAINRTVDAIARGDIVFVGTMHLTPNARHEAYAKEVANQQYYSRRNATAARSHLKNRLKPISRIASSSLQKSESMQTKSNPFPQSRRRAKFITNQALSS